MTAKRLGLSVLSMLALTVFIGCETHRDTRHQPSSQSGRSVQQTPSQAGSPGQQGSMSGASPMEHDKGGEQMIK